MNLHINVDLSLSIFLYLSTYLSICQSQFICLSGDNQVKLADLLVTSILTKFHILDLGYIKLGGLLLPKKKRGADF